MANRVSDRRYSLANVLAVVVALGMLTACSEQRRSPGPAVSPDSNGRMAPAVQSGAPAR